MTLYNRPLRDAANEANPNKAPAVLREMAFGDFAHGALRYYRGAVAANRLALPEGAKAVALIQARAIAATSAGLKTPVLEGATLSAGEAAIGPTGDVLFEGTDAVTEAEVWYFAPEVAPVEVEIAVAPATGVGSLAPRAGYKLIEAEALAGSVTGAATVLVRGATPSTGEAALSANGESVQFLIADAVTRARVVFVPQPGFGPTPPSVAAKMAENRNV